jgi:hypothetical protein
MPTNLLVYVAAFGAAVVIFLWLRDARIMARTGLAGYRRAAYQGVLFTALSLLGVSVASAGWDMVGLGLVLLALYLQGRIVREKIWTDETTVERMFGSAPRRRP